MLRNKKNHSSFFFERFYQKFFGILRQTQIIADLDPKITVQEIKWYGCRWIRNSGNFFVRLNYSDVIVGDRFLEKLFSLCNVSRSRVKKKYCLFRLCVK